MPESCALRRESGAAPRPVSWPHPQPTECFRAPAHRLNCSTLGLGRAVCMDEEEGAPYVLVRPCSLAEAHVCSRGARICEVRGAARRRGRKMEESRRGRGRGRSVRLRLCAETEANSSVVRARGAGTQVPHAWPVPTFWRDDGFASLCARRILAGERRGMPARARAHALYGRSGSQAGQPAAFANFLGVQIGVDVDATIWP